MKGFALIEIILAISISSIIGIALFSGLFQIYNSEEQVAETVSVGRRVAIITERMQKDLTGMFWPKLTQDDSKKKTEQENGEQEEKQQPTIKKILFSENQQIAENIESLKELTFITANPLQVYGEAKPRATRVIYTLEEEQDLKNSYALFRKGSINLDYKEARDDAQSYSLATGLRYLYLTYYFVVAAEDGKESRVEQDLNQSKVLDFSEDIFFKKIHGIFFK